MKRLRNDRRSDKCQDVQAWPNRENRKQSKSALAVTNTVGHRNLPQFPIAWSDAESPFLHSLRTSTLLLCEAASITSSFYHNINDTTPNAFNHPSDLLLLIAKVFDSLEEHLSEALVSCKPRSATILLALSASASPVHSTSARGITVDLPVTTRKAFTTA